MAEQQKEVLAALSEALPHMTEKEVGYFLGYSEAVSDRQKAEAAEAAPPKNLERYGLKGD